MSRIKPQKLKGFQDLGPIAMQFKESFVHKARQIAQLADFVEIDTPTIEYAETLLGQGGETDKQIFRFLDNGERDVALRFDLTMPFARYVAENVHTLPMPFKKMQVGKVFRAEKPQKGRYREFTQFDLDIVGCVSKESDLEILLTFKQILSSLIDEPFLIVLNSRNVLSALIKHFLGDVSSDLEKEILIILDKLDKIGLEKTKGLLTNQLNIAHDHADALLHLITSKNQEEQLRPLLSVNPELLKSYDELYWVKEQLNKLFPSEKISAQIDLSIARGLGYYTGIVFETFLQNEKGLGSICSGGRYDHLVNRFVPQEVSGIGGSIGVDRLLSYLIKNPEEHGLFAQSVYIAIAEQSAFEYAFEIAQELRSAHIRTNIAIKQQKLGAQFKHASRAGYAYVITIGDAEKNTNQVRLKNMATTFEESLAREDLTKALQSLKL